MKAKQGPPLWVVLVVGATLILVPLLLLALGILSIAPARVVRGYGSTVDRVPVVIAETGAPASEVSVPVDGVLLPHSAKGYELYSWFDPDASVWTFSLVTGTNRLKTFSELREPKSIMNADGWVSFTVRGFDMLRDLLDMLPSGEQVTWIDESWLEKAGAEREMIEAIRLPGEALVTELVAFCGERGVSLLTTVAPGD